MGTPFAMTVARQIVRLNPVGHVHQSRLVDQICA
jgi:hypothetical protein